MRYLYRRTWRSEVGNTIAVFCFIYPFAIFWVYLFSYAIVPTIFASVLVAILTAIGCFHVRSAVKSKTDFVCAIEDDYLRCVCPDRTSGESFKIAIADLSIIEVNDGWVTLKMDDGCEYWLTSNYGNPSGYFINLLLEANPNGKLVHV